MDNAYEFSPWSWACVADNLWKNFAFTRKNSENRKYKLSSSYISADYVLFDSWSTLIYTFMFSSWYLHAPLNIETMLS